MFVGQTVRVAENDGHPSFIGAINEITPYTVWVTESIITVHGIVVEYWPVDPQNIMEDVDGVD